MYINMYVKYYMRKIILKEFIVNEETYITKKIFMKSIGYTSKEI